MEVDGRKIRQYLYQGSNDVHEFPCSPCAKEGKNVAAAKHCVECDENMCSTCLNHHNKFSSMKGHQLLDTVKTPSEERPELPSQRCDKHGGKLIDVYCPGHDKVGCSTCIAVEHSTCQGMRFIPDIAKHSKSSEELQQLEAAINSLQSRFLTLKQKKRADLDSLKQEKDQLQQEIRAERKKINDELDKMENELLCELDAIFQMKMQNIDSSMKEIEKILASLRNDQHKMQAARKENVSEKYVQVKLGHERKNISKDRLDALENSDEIYKLWFNPYNQERNLTNNMIGRVIKYSTVRVGKFIGEINTKVGDDNDSGLILDMCLCTDGNIFITDCINKRIKKLNESYSVTSYLTVNDSPIGICQIDAFLLAIGLPNKKKVQFISQKEPMALQKSFNVGDRCRGIVFNDGFMYVCCGGSREREEGVGHVEVYTISGALLTSYYGDIECPAYVTVPNWTSDIYVVDAYGYLLIISNDGKLRTIPIKHMQLRGVQGFCWINRNQMCIVGYSSKNIVLMSCDGKVHEELLTEKDGIANACAVCFDEKRSRLLISIDKSNKIKVYNLNIGNY